MNKTFKQIAILLASALALTSCIIDSSKDKNGNDINSINEITYSLSGFDQIESELVGNLFIEQADSFSVRAEGPIGRIDLLDVKMDGSTLKIWSDPDRANKGNRSRKKITLYVTAPSLSHLDISSAGNTTLANQWTLDELDIESDGVGNLNIENLDCQTLNLRSEAVGNVSATGKAKQIVLEVDGTGNVDFGGFISANTTLINNGVGNVDCYASESIDITNKGVGNVTYSGNPAQKNISGDHAQNVKAQ